MAVLVYAYLTRELSTYFSNLKFLATVLQHTGNVVMVTAVGDFLYIVVYEIERQYDAMTL